MTLEEKYQEALDAIQVLLNTYGCLTPVWEKPREIIDRERPLIPVEEGK